MEDWSAGACRRPPMWSHWTEGIHPDYRDLAREVQVADEVKLHKYAAHLLSSQVFALNLFLPFREGSRKALSECVSRTVGTRLLVEEVRFEWVPPGALLGELEGDRPGEDEPGHWEVRKGILPDPDMAPSLRASAVIDAGGAEGYGAWAAWMRERYRLGETE